MYIKTLLFLSILLVITPVISMENNIKSALIALPKEAFIVVVAYCETKNVLRETCTYFHDFASRRKNENILIQPQLCLTQEALDRYLLYYGALGNVAIVRNLLAKGANPNACEDNGITLMHYAMQYGYNDIVTMLLEHPNLITTDIFNSEKFSCLPAIQSNQPVIIERIFSSCTIDDGEALYYAIKNGLYTTVLTLLRTIGPNIMNKKEEPLLCLATQENQINIMKSLILKGAHVNGINDKIPLLIAAEYGYTSAVQLLIDHEANCNIQDSSLCTALHFACNFGHIQIIKILLEKGVNINEKNIHGNTPLHCATYQENSQLDVVKILLEKNACIDEKNDWNNTALDAAIKEDIKKLLIERGRKTKIHNGTEKKENCDIQ